MDEAGFLTAALKNDVNVAILAQLDTLQLPDCWLVSGALFQTVWNLQTGREPRYGIRDYDVFYFDPDTSWQAEDTAINRARQMFHRLGVTVEIRNQARVHLWYTEKFGVPYSPASRTADGIDRFLMPCAQVGVCRRESLSYRVYAPSGFSDIVDLVVRPNKANQNFQATPYLEKCTRWKRLWPELTILPPEFPMPNVEST